MKLLPRKARQAVARLLAALMLLANIHGAPAVAQNAPPTTVYLLDFNNRTTVGGALLGRIAASQVALAMAESSAWDLVPDSQVQRRIEELGLKQPFDRIDRARIAAGVDATGVVYGSITEARVHGGNAPFAEVRLQILVEDTATGELINGSVAEGRSVPRMGFSGNADLLLEEALGKAAYQGRRLLDTFRLPQGTVLNTTVVGQGDSIDLDALMNVGARQGVRRGMEMIVTRQKQVVGRVRVTQVDDDISTARVIQNIQGVRPEDRVRAVFSFSDFPTGSRSRLRALAPAAPNAGAPGSLAAAPRAALTGEPKVVKVDRKSQFTLFRESDERSRMAQNNVPTPPPVVVDEPVVEPEVERQERGGGSVGGSALKMLVGGLLLVGLLAVGGRGGENSTRTDSMVSFGWQEAIGTPGAFIKVQWDRPKALNSDQVLQYIVWRLSILGEFAIVSAHESDAVHEFTDHGAARVVPRVYQGQPGTPDAGDQDDVPATGIQAGIQYRYQVATAFEHEVVDDQGEVTIENWMSPLSSPTPWTTAIAPARITDPTFDEQVNLRELEVVWAQTPGANEYFIWLSANPTFNRGSRVIFGPYTTVPVDHGGPVELSQIINADVRKLAGARRVYITVGARNSTDKYNPKPFGAIFSPAVGVQPEVVPPPPPGGSSETGDGKGGKSGGKNRKGRGGRGK